MKALGCVNVLIGYADPGRWKSLCAMLNRDALSDLQIALQTAHLADILRKAGESRPEVLLLEYVRGATGTLQMLSALRQVSSTTRTLVLHDGVTPQQTIELIKRGANGALLQTGDDALICKAVRAVHQGQVWFSRIALLQAILHLPDGAPVDTPLYDESLTLREREIMRFIGLGLTNKEIARQLDISDKTVKTHLHRIYVKLRLSGRYKAFLAQPLFRPTPLLVRSTRSPKERPELEA